VVSHQVSSVRLVTAALLLALWIPIGMLPALWQLGAVAGIVLAALVAESVLYRDSRRRIRAELAHH
jgi:hypothetical protein